MTSEDAEDAIEHARVKALLETLKGMCDGNNLESLHEAELSLRGSPNSQVTRAIEGNLLKMKERIPATVWRWLIPIYREDALQFFVGIRNCAHGRGQSLPKVG